jgi:hypothetical protein
MNLFKSLFLIIVFFISTINTRAQQDTILYKSKYGRNIISYNLADLVIFKNITFSYERLSSNGMIGYEIPVAIGFGYIENEYSYKPKNVLYTGFSLNYYPTNQGVMKYFVGTELRGGYAQRKYNIYDYDFYPYTCYTEKSYPYYYKIFINNGIIYNPTTNLTVLIKLSLGVEYYESGGYHSNGVYQSVAFSFNLGYRF